VRLNELRHRRAERARRRLEISGRLHRVPVEQHHRVPRPRQQQGGELPAALPPTTTIRIAEP
jgi:hypothetical protein